MPTCLRVFAIVFLTCTSATAVDWPQFRGPNADGTSAATGVPIEWTSSEHVAWKTPIPGEGWSSPVLSDGRIYLTTAIGDAKSEDGVSLNAVCVDASSGRIIWNVEVFRPGAGDTRQLHMKNSLASATPLIDGDRLYVHFGHMGTAALDLDGNIVWRQQGLHYMPVHGNGGSPVLVDDLLIFSCDAVSDPFVAALDSATGDIRWRTPRNTQAQKKFSFCTPTAIEVDGHTLVISPGSGFVGAYDPSDGREIWRVTYGNGYSVIPRPVFARGLIFVSSGFMPPKLLAIDPQDATGDATDDHTVWTRDRGAPLTPSPLVIGDDLYLIADNGIATCLDARTGEVHWTKRLGGNFSASPVSADGRIYLQNEDGTIYVIRADKSYELLATNDLDERALASPAVTDGAIILRTKSQLWRIE